MTDYKPKGYVINDNFNNSLIFKIEGVKFGLAGHLLFIFKFNMFSVSSFDLAQ